jgi:hypothetical protein
VDEKCVFGDLIISYWCGTGVPQGFKKPNTYFDVTNKIVEYANSNFR